MLFRGSFYKVSLKCPPPVNTLTSRSPYKVGLIKLEKTIYVLPKSAKEKPIVGAFMTKMESISFVSVVTNVTIDYRAHENLAAPP